jgi:hypothetical protein
LDLSESGSACSQWDDPRFRALNPSLTLPHARINLIGRGDAAGMNLIVSRLFTKYNAQWKSTLGINNKIA